MTLSPGWRKAALGCHVACSVGWIGAVAAYLALAIAALASPDADTVRACWIAMALIGWSAIVPLALASLATGFINTLVTPWGLFRHYWVVVKLLATVFATGILILHMPSVTAIAADARAAEAGAAASLGSDLLHAGGGLVVLLVIMVLGMVKPKGLTPHGWRRQHQARTGP